LSAIEILDSRSRPTLTVTLQVHDGTLVNAGVPAGASTGSREAVELRDGDEHRYAGQGVRQAVANVNGEIADALVGRAFESLDEVDHSLIELDGTHDKHRLGANAVVGVSMAAARAFAASRGEPLWQYLQPTGVAARLPVPHFNVVNGGVHAPNELDFQEFMLAPLGSPSLAEALRAGSEIYAALKKILMAKGLAAGVGDEGGFAPEIARPEDVLALLVQAITDAGYRAGRDGVAIALDPASSEFYREGAYHVAGETLSSADMITRYEEMVSSYPIWSLEDGLAESDESGWELLTQRLGERVQLVGDDNLVTNPAIISRAIAHRAGTAALIKVNQVGTVTETLEAMALCRDAQWGQMVSHRSGETTDSFIADLAVGSGCGQLKSGAPARGERVAKYNRLVEIEATSPMPFGLA
jgi:enolase